MLDSTVALAGLWKLAQGRREALEQAVLTGHEPALPSSFEMGVAAQATIAASALAATEVHAARGGTAQQVSVDMRHAAAEFRSERYMRIAGFDPIEWDKIAGVYRTGDGRYVRLHTNLPHHREGMLKLLGAEYERASVAKALERWQGEPFETAATAAGLVAAMMRSEAEWQAHGQGQALAGLPVIIIDRIGEGAPRARKAGEQPLSDVRVLDLTRIIAGPVCGRTLAAHGADVLLITGPGLPSVPRLVMDTGRGKRSAHVDLRTPSGRECLAALAKGADVFVQGYRPGAIAGKGFSAERLAELSPGIVCVSLSAYGYTGPWAGKRGFDSLVQTASGFNREEGRAAGLEEPKELPCQALDHGSGFLMAFGAMMALRRQMAEGGSWHVRVSLVQTGAWIKSLGRLGGALGAPDQTREDVAELLEASDSGFGAMTAVRHAGLLSRTPARWRLPSVPLGTHRAEWPRL